MRATFRAAVLLLRRQGRDGARDLAFTVLGVAVPVALIVILAGVLTGLGTRADRSAWREPSSPRDSTGSFVLQRNADAHLGDLIVRVDLAPIPGRVQPVPPGLAAFPAPGEVWVSPALADRIADHPDDHLGDRWPGTIVGTLGDAGLARPDELVVVVGHEPGGIVPTAEPLYLDGEMIRAVDPSDALVAESFATYGTSTGLASVIASLAVIGAVLLLVPALQLSAAAARFTTNRRATRLAALRLAGAAPGQILIMAALEAAVASSVGAVLGIALSAALLRPFALVPLGGGVWFPGDLWPGLDAVVAIAIVVVALDTFAVLLTLRRTARAPLGVVTGQPRRRPSPWRLLAAAALWVLFVATVANARGTDASMPLAVGTGAVIASIAVVGPWLTWLLGAAAGGLARRIPLLLAGRRLQADPIGSFRPVAGIVLVGFVAGLILTVLPMLDRPAPAPGDRTELTLHATRILDGRDEVDAWTPDLIAAADVRVGALALAPATVDDDGLHVTVAGADVEAARAALTDLVPGRAAFTQLDQAWEERVLVGDLGRAAAVATLTMIVLAVLATGLAAAADILEQRSTLRALHLAGTDSSVLQRARRWQAVLPLGGATTVSVASGAAAGLLLLVAFQRDHLPTVPIAALLALVVAGPVAGVIAAAATKPLLRSAAAA